MTPDIDITEDMVINWASKVKSEGIFNVIELLCARKITIQDLRDDVLEYQPSESPNTTKDTHDADLDMPCDITTEAERIAEQERLFKLYNSKDTQ